MIVVKGGSVLRLEDAKKLATEQLLIEVAGAKECEKNYCQQITCQGSPVFKSLNFLF
ncbi:hypothetical protein BLFGPEAP_00519 [Candidatus Methanoperedenaceae archaeon GB50]|nr:hypothetical protein BLFGPEAP_00519 [Candidatus Methanoperedenaceae archaeon GB50]